MNILVLILLCGTLAQALGGVEQEEARQDAQGSSALIDVDNSDGSADVTGDTDAAVSFSLNDVIHRLLQQQEKIRQLQMEMATMARERTVQAFRCESGVLTTSFPSGSGWRHREPTATFSRHFRTTPVVTVGLRQLDNYRDRNLRIRVGVRSVYTSHLIVRISTWADTRLASVGVNWMACA